MTHTTPQRQSSRGGFSLAELIIAVGILAVGMVMVGALFPAAIRANQSTRRNVLWSIICENGIAAAKALYSVHTEPPGYANSSALRLGSEELVVEADDAVTDLLSRNGRVFPQQDYASEYGFMWLARRYNDDDDDETFEGYQMVMVSFKRREPTDGRVVFAQRLISYQPGSTSVTMATVESKNMFRQGSPVILRASGDFSTITQALSNGQAATIDRPLMPADSGSTSAGLRAYMVVEQLDGGTRDHRFSPAMTTMTTRFGLLGN
jgi:hypothetical protein